MIGWCIFYLFFGVVTIAIFLFANEIDINFEEIDIIEFLGYVMMFFFWPIVFGVFAFVYLFGKVLKLSSFLAGFFSSFRKGGK